MFKFLKKKYRRSDWMEGLLAAEKYDQCGVSPKSIDELWLRHDLIKYAEGAESFLSYKKYLDSIDK